jgi:solute carrier family 35 protein E1
MKKMMKDSKDIKLALYFVLLYFFTVVYNVTNKNALLDFPLPSSLATLQVFIGIPLFLPIWIMKQPNNLFSINFLSYFKISLFHTLGNLATIFSLNAGSVSFTHIVKSSEPVFTAFLSFVILKNVFTYEVYLTLLPIIIGVAICSFKEFSFSWFGLLTALLSNLFYQLRIVFSKQLLNGNHEAISGANLFRVITIFSFFQLFLISLFLEGNELIIFFKTIPQKNMNINNLMYNIVVSGLSFHIYNEIAFWILDLVHPITHAVGNTIKRVVIVIASIVIFKQPINSLSLFGAFLAIAGSFLYSLAHERFHNNNVKNSGLIK